MLISKTESAPFFSSGSDVWIFSKRNAAYDTHIVWALNLLPLRKSSNHIAPTYNLFHSLGAELGFEIESLDLSTSKDSPLLIDSSQLLPTARTVIISDDDPQGFIRQLQDVLGGFEGLKPRVFLPPDLNIKMLKNSFSDSNIEWVEDENSDR